MSSASTQISERAARAALSTFRRPSDVAADIAAVGAAEVWQRLAANHPRGPIAEYRPEEELSAAQLTAQFVIPGDDAWPIDLEALGEQCPLGLWVRGTGDLADLSESAVAVTGGRAATPVGTGCAADVARELDAAGHTVASTLSYGIDTAAQSAAHAASAPTLAVLPCGLDNCHPRNQAELMTRVLARGGAAVSAYRPGTQTTMNTLAYSARLLAALSGAVVLVEPAADIRTVPLETAQAAARMGIPVHVMTAVGPSYALPPGGKTERLLKRIGARTADSAATLLTALT